MAVTKIEYIWLLQYWKTTMSRMCSLKPLEASIERLTVQNTAIEVGTYYAGWTRWLAEHFNQVITLQTPHSNKLNHIEDTAEGEFSENLPWKNIMRSRIPEQYHSKYDFNFLAEQVSDLSNTLTVLQASPPSVQLPWTWDLCTIDISRDPAEHLRQYKYWRHSANPGGSLLMGIYKPTDYDSFALTQTQFLDSITQPWSWTDDNYIIVEF